MQGKKIASLDSLGEWLLKSHPSYAKVIAFRAAMRAFPLLSQESNEWLLLYSLKIIRANVTAWIGLDPDDDVFAQSALSAYLSGYSSGNVEAGAAAIAAAEAVGSRTGGMTQRAALAAVRHAINASINSSLEAWAAVDLDCGWLAARGGGLEQYTAYSLSRYKLWPNDPSSDYKLRWKRLANQLLEIDPNFSIWINWYDGRVKGDRAAFRTKKYDFLTNDADIFRRLAAATDEDFWGKGHKYANATLKAWLEEARERAEESLTNASAPKNQSIPLNRVQPAIIPVQSETALRFARDPEGKIALCGDKDLRELRKDEDARDRHQLAVEDAKQLLAACAGLNSAERLTAILTAYIAAAGETLEEMRPSLFVQKGERLRQELARYEAGDTDLPPLPDRVLLDLKSVCKAHNMVVGLDPALMARDTAQLPPDAVVGDVTPAEVRDFVHGADEAGILQSDVPDIMDEAVALVPPGADATDRRFRWCVESCRNLVIEAFTIALNKPVTATAIVAGNYALGPQFFVGNALAFGVFLVSRRQWIEERLGRHAPTWQALFVDLCERLEKHTPLSEATKNK